MVFGFSFRQSGVFHLTALTKDCKDVACNVSTHKRNINCLPQAGVFTIAVRLRYKLLYIRQ